MAKSALDSFGVKGKPVIMKLSVTSRLFKSDCGTCHGHIVAT